VLVFRRIVEDYEARLVALEPARTGPVAAAKAEHERFADGEVRFKIRLRQLALPDGAQVTVHLRDGKVGSATVGKGRAELVLASSTGAAVPSVREGDRIAVTHDGVALFAGVFVPD
jgi:hypothetical protein